MANILLVEDAKFFRSVLTSQIEGKLGHQVTPVENYKDAVAELTSGNTEYELALLDLNLPDAPDGEIVDMVSGKDIPSIIFSGSFLEEIRDQLEKQHVIDYIVKDSPASLNYVLNTIDRFFKNKVCKVLVVDDSKVSAKHMAGLLEEFNFNVITAHNGHDALKRFNEHPDIRLIICDYNMPDMSGVDVCKRVRAKKNRDEVCIIGVSAYGTHALSAQFLKAGANDFLVKPFLTEEFLCRVTLNMDSLDKIDALDAMVYKDLVTNLKNRRYLEENLLEICAQAQSISRMPVCGFFELSDFREFNDAHGNDAGDTILKLIADEIKSQLREAAMVVRYGGSQFCIITTPQDVDASIDNLRQTFDHLCKNTYSHDGNNLKISMKAGIAIGQEDKLADIIIEAKNAISVAKQDTNCHFYIAR